MKILVDNKYPFSLAPSELENTHSQLSKLLELAAENQPLKRAGEDMEYGMQHFPKLIELENALKYMIDNKLHQPKVPTTSKIDPFFVTRLFRSIRGFLRAI